MTASLTLNLFEQLNPLRLAGPLLERELRVSSRRRRTYILRVGYVAIMCLFALAAWCWIMSVQRANTTFGASRSAEVGLRVTANVLWFQFMATQLIAAAMLSSSMADEMHRGGLSILLTTPITSTQIVLGKLLSRMWQVLLLMAISLPALAVVRVMGAISWDAVAGSLCITATASLFVGALCLWLSTYCRYPHQVISGAAVIYLVVFVALPAMVLATLSIAGLSEPLLSSIVTLVNPRSALFSSMYPAWYRRPAGSETFHSWSAHCLIMLGITVFLLGLCARRLRRISVRTIGLAGQGLRSSAACQRRAPIVMREFMGNLTRWRWGNLLLLTGTAVVCALIVLGSVRLGRQSRFFVYTRDIVWVCGMVALMRLAVLAAGAFGREKEGRTLPLLLTTPLGERRIVRGKLRAVFDRGIPWILGAVVVHICYASCLLSRGDPWGASCYVIGMATSAFFVTGAGLYCGARLKTTTTAVVVTLGAHLFLHHLLIGYYNPLYVWLMYKILLVPRRSGMAMVLFGVGAFLVVAALQLGLGLFLLRRTAGTLRRCV